MTPARTNQNWLPSIFNEFLDNNWLAATPRLLPSTSSKTKTSTKWRSPLRA